ncbi:tetraspanin [Hirsutella rhossiliensis]|uniref:Tetraspanin n=1 Tax=Hirsutella rhossiliensis TaxID=111463 RepID=A0A9P8SIQ3_9HYPO|nr:tetraspanin [Hirsutella rhossiliensis]KAH0964126.1 tetraspanin [Hirsutella rhossiliensis]
MPNKVFLAALAADVVFLITGCLELGFSLVVRSQLFNNPQDGQEAVRNLLYQSFPLIAGIVNASFILAASVFTLIGLMSPMRGFLKAGGYTVAFCGLFTLCVGVFLWVSTLKIKETFFPVYVAQDPTVQQLIQTSFTCCGYFNHTTPAFVTDAICPSPAAAALLRGCGTAISNFSNIFIDNIFTAVFGMVGMDAILILAIACLLKDRKERERYRHIDEKTGFRHF